MGDVGDDYSAFNEARKEERAKRFEETMAELERLKVSYISKNLGHHLIIGDFDFWPSSGKFRNRKTNKYGFGLESLLQNLNNF